jgi:hypothetical protein
MVRLASPFVDARFAVIYFLLTCGPPNEQGAERMRKHPVSVRDAQPKVVSRNIIAASPTINPVVTRPPPAIRACASGMMSDATT